MRRHDVSSSDFGGRGYLDPTGLGQVMVCCLVLCTVEFCHLQKQTSSAKTVYGMLLAAMPPRIERQTPRDTFNM